MKWYNKQKYFTKYVLCVVLLFVLLFLSTQILSSDASFEEVKINNTVVTKNTIEDNTDIYKINVNYPKFKNEKLNSIVVNWLYDYIKTFKKNSKELENSITTLDINYELYFINGHANIFFDINNSLDYKDTSKSILIDLSKNSLSHINEIFSEDLIKESINSSIKKYPSFVSNAIVNVDYKDQDYKIDDDGFIIFFNNIDYGRKISYIPQIIVDLETAVNEEYQVDSSKKMVALTYDDGPSIHSLEILECLKQNNAKATFFELGGSIVNHKEISKALYDAGMEVGNHSYSHKYLTKIPISEALEQINSTTIAFNEATGGNMTLMRAPYGSVNAKVRENAPYPLISWNIDTKDWLYKNAETSAPIVLDYVSDGDIILMHDIHYPTIELTRMIVPELKARGYELVTVSELAKYKNYKLEPGVVTREIKVSGE